MSNVGEGVELSYTVARNRKLCNHFGKQFIIYLKTAYFLSSYLGHFLKGKTAYVHTKTYTEMFTAALFIRAPNQKQPESPAQWKG